MAWIFDPESADETGLVGVGADLEPQTLIEAYQAGCFPTRFEPFNDERLPMFWWSPDPRAIIELDQLHVSQRMVRTLRSGKFATTINQAFDQVMLGCAERGSEGTWITADIRTAYCRLHTMGVAHSVEIWQDGKLVGGTYGVAIGGLFAAESMFHRVSDASKVAIVELVNRLRAKRFQLLDIQMLSPHTARLGGSEIPRSEYLGRLQLALKQSSRFF